MAKTQVRADSAQVTNIAANRPPEYLALEVSRFLREHRIPPSRFGRDAVGDPRFPTDLFHGRIVRPGTAAKVRAFIASRGGVRHGD